MSPARVAQRLSGWGRYPVADCELTRPRTAEAALKLLEDEGAALIARGCGRSYGDSSLNQRLTVDTGALDRILSFDAERGTVTCEAGVTISDLIATFLPRGWFPWVTPGTKFVSVGGAIAADVHGKNHHRDGSFSEFVDFIDLVLGRGRVERCSREENPELFAATCGGMGLTGLILRAGLRLRKVASASIRQRRIRTAGLDATMEALNEGSSWTYSVAWIDCMSKGAALGRGVVFLGEHAKVEELAGSTRGSPLQVKSGRRAGVPIDLPAFALGSRAVQLFNAAYYRLQAPAEGLTGADPYFFPLDGIANWNRAYGRRGFVQYQCVMPGDESRDGMQRLLSAISAARTGSFLAVLKKMGQESAGALSFPMPGYTLALDFPVSEANLALLDRLDAILAEHRGRIDLAKDARASADTVRSGYPRLAAFLEVRQRFGLTERFSSMQSQRLKL